jgi:hypothetical protein
LEKMWIVKVLLMLSLQENPYSYALQKIRKRIQLKKDDWYIYIYIYINNYHRRTINLIKNSRNHRK